jgi:hypothetical protein
MSLRSTVTVALVPFVFAALHCHDHDEEEGPPASLADVLFADGTTDEALEALLATPPKAGDKRAHFSAPKAGDKVSEPPAFAWSYEAKTGSVSPELRQRGRGARGWGMPLAHAHGTPMNGTGYLLVVSTASDPKLLRVFTKATSFTPDAAAWERIKQSTGTVKAEVVTGLFENNKIVSNGGPFEGEAISFEVAR